MFFVFGPQGQMYRGGPENLTRIAPVRRVLRPQALNTRAADGVGGFALPPDVAPPPSTPAAAQPAPSPAPAHLRAQDAAAAYAQTEKGSPSTRQPLTRVSDVMTQGAVTVQADARVNDAWQTLAERGVSQAPVLNAKGQVVGLLLRADMAPLDLLPAPGAVQDAIALARRPVDQVMLSPIPTVDAQTELRRVAQVLLDTGLPGLPVTDAQGALLGFLSRTDILRAVAADPPLDLWSGPAVPL
jgi:CBS domain-containing protein